MWNLSLFIWLKDKRDIDLEWCKHIDLLEKKLFNSWRMATECREAFNGKTCLTFTQGNLQYNVLYGNWRAHYWKQVLRNYSCRYSALISFPPFCLEHGYVFGIDIRYEALCQFSLIKVQYDIKNLFFLYNLFLEFTVLSCSNIIEQLILSVKYSSLDTYDFP